MARRLLILVFILLLPEFRCFSQVISTDDKLRQTVNNYGQAEVTIPFTDKKSVEILTTNVSILSVKDKVVYISLSPLTVEWFILNKYDYKIVEPIATKGLVSATTLNEALLWDNYPRYTQYDSIMQYFASKYPSLCRVDTIGTSINGKLVLALKISDNVAADEAEPDVFYTSSMHGDETGGFVLMLHLADYLLKNYSVNTRVKNLVDNLEIWINPLSNPDGTYKSGNTIISPSRFNASGYDLNRNFPDPFTPNTIKTKETVDMIKFMRKHKFVLSANFHSGTEVVNYPWDRWLTKFHADNPWFKNISRAYADTVHYYAGPAYMNFLDNGITRGSEWYVVYGGRQDFVTSELQGREVTIELDDQYITPSAQLTLLWQNNWHSLLGYLENALYGIHGLVRNANSLVPVSAKIFISGHDTDSSHVYSDTLTGSFVRFLSPGTWNLTFSAAGYFPKIMNNIIVAERQRTDLIVDMKTLVDGIENPDSSNKIVLFPNPARSYISALLPDIMTGNFNIRIINQTGMLISDYNIKTVQGIPFLVDINSLSSGVYTIIFSDDVRRRVLYSRFVVIK